MVIAIIAALAGYSSALAGPQPQFAVVVNSSVHKTSISRTEIRQIMLANQTKWPGGKTIVIVALSPDAPQGDAITQEYMSLTADQARKHWLTKVFSLAMEAVPAAEDTPEDVIEKVASTPGAFAVVPRGTGLGKAVLLEQTN